jgi:protein AroM
MTPGMRVGFITVGQSPRDDVLSELPDTLRNIQAVQIGALDKLTTSQIVAMRPTENETVYVSRLRDSSVVSIAKEKLIPILEEKIELLRKDVDAVVILCSGNMALRNSGNVIFPSELLRQAVESMTTGNDRKVGVIIPEESQTRAARNDWKDFADEIKVVSFSPYSEPIEHLVACSKRLNDRHLIVMDWIGYSRRHTEIVHNVTSKPVVAVWSVTFQFLEKNACNLARAGN